MLSAFPELSDLPLPFHDMLQTTKESNYKLGKLCSMSVPKWLRKVATILSLSDVDYV